MLTLPPDSDPLFEFHKSCDAPHLSKPRASPLMWSQAFCRKFNWAELMLWPDDIPERCLVVVSGLDDLVPSALVVRQLQAAKHPAKIMHHPLLGHGGILLLNNWQRQVIASMGQFLKEV